MGNIISLSKTIQPNEDQITHQSLNDGPKRIKITSVTQLDPTSQQPVHIHYDGENKKPFKPCLTMRKLLDAAWGECDYVGREIVVFNDKTVTFSKDKGGVRISHLSNIQKTIYVRLKSSRGKYKVWTVDPIPQESPQEPPAPLPVSQKVIDSIKGHAKFSELDEATKAELEQPLFKPRMTEIVNLLKALGDTKKDEDNV